MFTEFKVAPVLAFAQTSTDPAATSAQTAERAPRVARGHRATSVASYRTPAQLELQRDRAEMHSGDVCDWAFDTENVGVEVDSGGTGFWVPLVAPDTRTGEEELRRAQLFLA